LGNSHIFWKNGNEKSLFHPKCIHVDTTENIYKETVNGNQLNDKHAMMSIKILEAIKSESHCT